MKKILVIPDTHAPVHHKPSWDHMIRFAKNYKPNIIVHLGDFLDLYYASRHDKLAPAPALTKEFSVGNRLLDELDTLGAERKVLCKGNHETRLARLIAAKLPEIEDIVPKVEDLLKLKARGWEVHPYGKPVKIGKVYYVHDVSTNSTKTILLNSGGNFVTGHTHRLEQVFGGTYRGEQHVAIMAGWLGDPNKVNFDYANDVSKASTWTRGFVTGEMDQKGNTHFTLRPTLK